MKQRTNLSTIISLLLVLFIFAACAHADWWKGNLHTHTLWSDGCDYPEMVADWYKKNGYNFLALSDHNMLLQGQKWTDANDNRAGIQAFTEYLHRFGEKWVDRQMVNGKLQVRLKTLSEFRPLFEKPDRFLLIQAEEITTKKKLHMNAVNLSEPIQPQLAETVVETFQNNIDAVLLQSKTTGRPILSHINHPNWHWALTAEEIAQLRGISFFEVYNGIPSTHTDGDRNHAGTERIWDIILTKRLAELNLPIMYGIASDDAHHYRLAGKNIPNAGRGWVTVQASHLTPESLIKAMEAGDFYASTGVVLKDIQFDGKTLKILIEPQKGVSYTTQFIGTMKGYDPASRPVLDPNGAEIHTTRIYSSDIGKVLSEVKGTTAAYTAAGSEIYIRAKITSTKPKDNPSLPGDLEVAWVQPVVPAAR